MAGDGQSSHAHSICVGHLIVHIEPDNYLYFPSRLDLRVKTHREISDGGSPGGAASFRCLLPPDSFVLLCDLTLLNLSQADNQGIENPLRYHRASYASVNAASPLMSAHRASQIADCILSHLVHSLYRKAKRGR